jgi:hypothetical protein
VSVGWLSCTWVAYFDSLEQFQSWAVAFVGELVAVPRRWRGYEVVYAGEHGVMVGLKVRDGGEVEIHLDVPARVLESLDHETLYGLLRCAAFYAQNVSRCDVTLDDWQKVMTPMGLDVLTSGADDAYALNREQLVTRAKESQFIRSKGPTGGDTWYLGGSSGEARLRVYDKARESGGEVDAVRWELQLRGDRAKDAVVSLIVAADGLAAGSRGLTRGLALAEVMGEQWASQLVRFVDFRDRSQDLNVSRCPRLGWFWSLVMSAGRARPVVVKPDLTVQRMHDYAAVALPSWLATLADSAPLVCGVSPELWLLSMLEDGRKNRSTRHALALKSGRAVAEDRSKVAEDKRREWAERLAEAAD